MSPSALSSLPRLAIAAAFSLSLACFPPHQCEDGECGGNDGGPSTTPDAGTAQGLELLRGFYSQEQCEGAPAETCIFANVYFVVKEGEKSVTDLTGADMDMVINGRQVGVEGQKKLTTSNGLLVRLLLDGSYSIRESNSTDAVRQSAVGFINSLPDSALVNPSRFASESQVPIFLRGDGTTSTDSGELMPKALAASTVENFYDSHQALTSSSQTKLYDAVGRLSQFSPNNPELKFLQAVMVLFTDGADTASIQYRTAAEAKSAATSANPNLRVYAVGFGNDIDEAALRVLSDGRFYKANDTTDLQRAFDAVSDDLSAIYLLRVLVAQVESGATADLTVRHGGRTLKTSFSMSSL